MASSLEREFRKNFHKQVFTEYQSVVMRHQDISYRCTVVDVSLTGGIYVPPKRGMIRKHTKIIVEVPELQCDYIIGANTSKSIFREGFNMDSLEEELASLGIGGMTSLFRKILHEAFGSRMVSPAQAKRLNLKHVKGILLYGLPGSGKTLVARSICKILNVKEASIVSGPELEQEFHGVTERKIRSLFEGAMKDEKQYGAESDLHIIVFDEFDSIAKQRGSANQHHADKVVNQLLTMIDGMSEMNNIIIIATTNRKDLIDKALLREGRIELHYKVDYPDEEGRLNILDVCTKRLRQASLLDKDVDLTEIARKTHGCSGAALASLVSRAHMYANVQSGEIGFLKHVGRTMKLSMDHFLRAVEDSISKLQDSDELSMEKGETMSPHSNFVSKPKFDLLLEEHKQLKANFYKLKMKMEKLDDAVSIGQELEGLIKLGSGKSV